MLWDFTPNLSEKTSIWRKKAPKIAYFCLHLHRNELFSLIKAIGGVGEFLGLK